MLALVEYLTVDDLVKIRNDEGLLDGTRKAALEELLRRTGDDL